MTRHGLATLMVALAGHGLITLPLQGQDVSGGLHGRIAGPDSLPLAGVVVEASSTALPRRQIIESNNGGEFRFLALPIGRYHLRIRAVGYRPVLYRNVLVGLGIVTELEPVLLERQVVELPEIAVLADPAPIDPTSTATATTITSDGFDALPISRSFRSIAALAPEADYQQPYLSVGATSEGVNIAGGTVWDNAYFVDGVDVTDPLRGASGTNLPYNFLQAVQVKTGGYEAEYGRALGGVVNMITPSGGNDFDGQAFSFIGDHRLRTAARYGKSEPNLDSYTQFDVGLALSGPIQRNRLWFYAAYNPIFDTRQAFFSGMSPKRDQNVQHRFAGKLTWQPSTTSHIVATVSGDPSWHDAVDGGDGFFPPSSVLNPDVVLASQRTGGESASLRLTQTVHSRLLLEAVGSVARFRDDIVPQTAFGDTTPNYIDQETGIASGGYGWHQRTRLGRNVVMTSATLAAGRHIIKTGLQFQDNTLSSRDAESYIGRVPDGTFIWDHISNVAQVANQVYTAYAQDAWEIAPRLRLDAGVRWEAQHWLGAGGALKQKIDDEWSPRLGVVFAPGRPGRQKIFASVGRFYEEVPLAAVAQFYGKGGYAVDSFAHDPRSDPTGAAFLYGGLFGSVQPVDGLRGEYYDELTAGYEQMVDGHLKLSVRGTYRVLRSAIEDTFIFGDTAVVGNPGERRLSAFPRPNHRYRAVAFALQWFGHGPFQLLASYVLSRNTGNYPGLFAGDGQAPNASSLFDIHNPGYISTGLLPGDRTNILKLAGSYQTRFGLGIGTFALLESGTPISKISVGGGYPAFVGAQGSAGRKPTIWDLNLRLDYQLPGLAVRGAGTRIVADLEHIGSPRRPVSVSQLHDFGADSTGSPILSRGYGKPLLYQPPMSLRLGMVIGF